MVAVKEITWEEASAPDFEHTPRQAFRAAVDQVAFRAKATLPECHGRVDKAVAIVLQGDVELLPDGHARVASQCQGSTVYRIVNGTCDCPDFPRAPSSWCKHRIAAGIQRRVMQAVQVALTSSTAPAQPAAAETHPLPEAPASANCALSDILATSLDNLAKNRVQMAIESRRRHFYAFEFYKIWYLYFYINYIYKF